MIYKILDRWFNKEVWYHTIRGIILMICSILYVICDDHTDKIITGVMSLLAIDCFIRKKSDDEK